MRAYPTFMLVDRAADICDVWLGFDGPDAWTGSLETALDDPASIAQKQERFAVDPDLPTARALARHATGTGSARAAVAYLRRCQKMDAENAGDYAMDVFEAMVDGLRDDEFAPSQVVEAADAALAVEDVEPMDTIIIAYYMGRAAAKAEDPALQDPYLARAIAATAGSEDPEVADGRAYLMPDYLLRVEKDPAGALAARKARLPEGWRQDPGALNELAWWCFENGVELETAEAMAREAVALEADDGEKANILDTAAEICHALGKSAEAADLIGRAVELAPESEHFREQLTRFRAAAE